MLLFMFLVPLMFGVSFAVFSADDFIAQFQSQQTKFSLQEKIIYDKKVLANLTLLALRNRNDTSQFTLYTSLKEYVSAQLLALQKHTLSSSLVSSWIAIPNLDLAKVRNAWLALHNSERQAQWVSLFTYSPALEWTASTWARHLADIRTTTHKRKSTDGYYSYASIKARFSDQWIVFSGSEHNGYPSFTENIWRNMYSCNTSDCTQDFIKAITKSWSFFMAEKGKSYSPHYNAIVGDFAEIGLGVALVGNKYYLVTHYSQDLK